MPVMGEGAGAMPAGGGAPGSRISSSDQRRLTAALALLGLAAVLAVLVGTGIRGIDFGEHWDEPRFLDSIAKTVQSGTLLPGAYHYPSVSYWLGLVPVASDWFSLQAQLRGEAPPSSPDTIERYLMRTRSLFLVVSAAAVLWVFLLVWMWRRRPLEAALAAAFLGTSWEVAYHLRWIAPDGVLMQLVALTALLCIAAGRGARPGRWLALGALSAGFACGTKYPGGAALLLVLIAAWCSRDRIARAFSGLAVRIVVLFAAAYLASTPGTLLQPAQFIEDLRFEIAHYQSGHPGHGIEAGLPHLRAMGTYLAAVQPGPYRPLAIGIFALAVLGALAVLRRSPAVAALLVLFPILYLAFLSLQRVMIVRNLLMVAPFVAILAARGAGAVAAILPRGAWRVAWGAALIAVVSAQGWFLHEAAESVADRGRSRTLREVEAFVASEPPNRIAASAGVRTALEDRGLALPLLEAPGSRPSGDRVLILPSEGPGASRVWPATTPDLLLTWFGPRQVNLNYYPSWVGTDHVFLITAARLQSLGLKVR
jgi:hypothetical protein